jgi:DNA-binding NtrC family response regulator
VRELRNVLERAMIMLTRDEIRSEDLALEPPSAATGAAASAGVPTTEWEIRPLDDVIATYVAGAVKATDGNVRKAARKLQISPSTLYARMKK